MGLNILLLALGLAASGYGLGGRSALRSALTPVGAILSIAALLKILAPGFF